MKLRTIYLDMDGVLCDFHLEAIRANLRAGLRIPILQHTGTPLELQGAYLRELWLQYAPSKSLQKWILPKHPNEEDEAWMARFWKPIATAAFVWENLEPYPWYKQVWELCNDYADFVEIVTTPGPTPSYSGKRAWITRYLGPQVEVCLRHRKWALSRPGTCLIDDYAKTAEKFASPQCGDNPLAHGCFVDMEPPANPLEKWVDVHNCHGQAITFPAPWNPLYGQCHNPLAYVESKLKEIIA